MKWRLWHGRAGHLIRDLEQLLVRLKEGEFSIARLHSLGAQLLTYVRPNRGAIVNYGKRYRAGLRVATTLAESAVSRRTYGQEAADALVASRCACARAGPGARSRANFATGCGRLSDRQN